MKRSIRLIVALLAFAVGGRAAQDKAAPLIGPQPPQPPLRLPQEERPVPPEIRGVRVIGPNLYEVQGARPLESAAELLQRKLGVPVSVEEPPWAASSDLKGVVEAATGRVGMYARGGTFTFAVQPRTDRGPGASETIRRVVSQYMAQNNPGEFEVLELGDQGFSIVPKRIKNDAGIFVESPRFLDMRISFPEQRRSLGETFSTFFDALTRVSGSRVVDANPAPNKDSTPLTFGASKERARDVLARLLRMRSLKASSWRLRYDPQWYSYGISLIWVEREIVDPDGRSRLAPVFWP